MTSEIYKKDISIFIFNENIYLARAIKDRIAPSEYDVHFYTDENLVRQSVYLALPHIVLLPSTQKYEKLLFDIRKMSREIQIIVLAPEEDYEAVLSLRRKGFIDDFIIDPLKYMESIPYRVDLACERWMLMSQIESQPQQQASGENLSKESFIEKAPLFTTSMPQVDLSQDSILSDILRAGTDVEAVRVTLERMASLTGKAFLYLEYDSIREVLALKDVSFGMRKDLEGLGIALNKVDNISEFLEKPHEYKIFKEFLSEVFSASECDTRLLKNGDDIFGMFIALARLDDGSSLILDRSLTGLVVKIDNVKKTRIIHNHVHMDREFSCYTNKVFYNKISDEISRSRRLTSPLSLLVFDVSGGARSEQRYAALVVAKVLQRFTRVTDLVGKVGLCQFGVLLPHCPLENAVEKARKLQAIVKAAFEENKITTVVVKAGVTAFPDQYSDAMSLLDAGERACSLADGFDVCLIDTSEDSVSLRDRIKGRIKGASL